MPMDSWIVWALLHSARPERLIERTSGLRAEGFGPAVVKRCFCDSRRTPLANGGRRGGDSPPTQRAWTRGPYTGCLDRAEPLARPTRAVAPRPTAPKELSWTLPRASRARNPKRRQRHAQSARHRILRRLTAKLRLVGPLWAPSRAN